MGTGRTYLARKKTGCLPLNQSSDLTHSASWMVLPRPDATDHLVRVIFIRVSRDLRARHNRRVIRLLRSASGTTRTTYFAQACSEFRVPSCAEATADMRRPRTTRFAFLIDHGSRGLSWIKKGLMKSRIRDRIIEAQSYSCSSQRCSFS